MLSQDTGFKFGDVNVIMMTSEKDGSGKDTAAEFLNCYLREFGVTTSLIAFSTPVINAYVSIFDEQRFDFYKVSPEKRQNVLDFSTGVKKVDPFVFVKKSIKAFRSQTEEYLDEQGENPVEIFFIFTDARYEYEYDFVNRTLWDIQEKYKVETSLYVLNVEKDQEKTALSDREGLFAPISLDRGNVVKIENNKSLKDLYDMVKSFVREGLPSE